MLGIGRAASVVLWSGLILFQTTSMYAESMRSDAYIGIVSSLVGMRAIPAVVVTAAGVAARAADDAIRRRLGP